MRARIGAWTVATAIVATFLYVLALRSDAYALTSPYWLTWHIALRKAYSIVAFTLVAYLYRRALGEHGATRFVARCIVATALYSAGIEGGQYVSGGREGVAWNLFDTLCGAIGGGLATADLWVTSKRRAGNLS